MDEIVENIILPDGMRRVRIISAAPISPLRWAEALPDEAVRLVELATAEDETLGIHSLVMTWPARDLVSGVILQGGTKIERPMVVWRLVDGERVSMVIRFAADMFERAVGRRPGFAWMKSLPKGINEFDEVQGFTVASVDVGGVVLRTADWAYSGCIFIGG